MALQKLNVESGDDVEMMAKALHEAGRKAVETGKTVAAANFGDISRKFLGWDDVSEEAREGRRMQAKEIISQFQIFVDR